MQWTESLIFSSRVLHGTMGYLDIRADFENSMVLLNLEEEPGGFDNKANCS